MFILASKATKSPRRVKTSGLISAKEQSLSIKARQRAWAIAAPLPTLAPSKPTAMANFRPSYRENPHPGSTLAF